MAEGLLCLFSGTPCDKSGARLLSGLQGSYHIVAQVERMRGARTAQHPTIPVAMAVAALSAGQRF